MFRTIALLSGLILLGHQALGQTICLQQQNEVTQLLTKENTIQSDEAFNEWDRQLDNALGELEYCTASSPNAQHNPNIMRGVERITANKEAAINRVRNRLNPELAQQEAAQNQVGAPDSNDCKLTINPQFLQMTFPKAYGLAGPPKLDKCIEWVGEEMRAGGGDRPLATYAEALANSIAPYKDSIQALEDYFRRSSVNCEAAVSRVEQELQKMFRTYGDVKVCMALFHLIPGDNVRDTNMARSNNITKKSSDGRIECQASGVVTRDFKGCSSIITAYEGSRIAQLGLETFQQLDYDHSLSKAEMKLMDNPDDPTNPLKMQEDALRKGAQISTQRAAFHTTKAGVIWALANSMPSPDDIFKECVGSPLSRSMALAKSRLLSITSNEGLKFEGDHPSVARIKASVGNFTNTVQSEDDRRGIEAACRRTVYQPSGVPELIMNRQSKDEAIAMTIEAAVEAGVNVADALMQRDNAKYARKARKKVEDFDPEVPEFPWDEMMLTACDHNPSLPECLGPGFRRGVVGGGDQFNFGGFEGGTSGAMVDEFNDPTPRASSDPTKRDPAGGLGSPIPNAHIPGGLESTLAPGSLERGQGPGGGGGGGGGAGVGGVGAPSSGGAANHDAEGRPNEGRAVAVSNQPTFAGGAGQFLGGAGLNRARGRDDRSENPFDRLLGDRAPSGEVLNYGTNDIAEEGDSLFKMISRRYNNVTRDDRLLPYDAK